MNKTPYPKRKSSQRFVEKPYQEAFQKSQQALRQFIQTVPVAICILDKQDGRYLDVNESFTEMIGAARLELLYHTHAELYYAIGQNNLQKILQTLQQNKKFKNVEMLFWTKNGQLIKAAASAESIDYAGKDCAMITIAAIPRDDRVARFLPSRENPLNVVSELGRTLAETLKLDEIYRQLASAVYQLLPEVCTIFISLYNSDYQRITCVFAEHDHEPVDISTLPELSLEPPGIGLQSEAIRSKQPLIVNNLQDRLRNVSLRFPVSKTGKTVQSGLYVPMLAHNAVIGVVQAQSYRPDHFKPADASLFSLVANTAAVAIKNTQLASSLEKTTQDLHQTYEATIEGWTRALELRDYGTERHTQRVVDLTIALGKKLGINGSELVKVRRGAQLHDIGKMGIPDTILLKPGPLDDAEWHIMRKHPSYAFEMLRPIPYFNDIIDIPYCHHEKWDGTGYPRRLRGEEIPLSARIFSIVDVWDALCSDRPYRPAWPHNQVIDYIQYQANKHFQPDIAKAFVELVRKPTSSSGRAANLSSMLI